MQNGLPRKGGKMKKHKDSEKRKYPRIESNFIISYRIKQLPADYDLTQTKNVSQGGLLLTTNKKFTPGTILAITIRFPFTPAGIEITGKIVDSEEVRKGWIYDTRIEFLDLDEKFFHKLGQFINKHSK